MEPGIDDLGTNDYEKPKTPPQSVKNTEKWFRLHKNTA